MSRTKALRRHRRQQREMILSAARELFHAKGYESFSMRRLAEQIGYSVGTLYLYFEDKNDLLHQLVEESFEVLYETLAALPDDADPKASLKRKLRAYVDFGLGYPSHYHFAFLIRREPGEAAPPHPAFDLLRASVKQCCEEGHFGSVEVEDASQVLWVAIHGLTSLLITRPGFPWIEHERLVSQLIDSAVEGLESI